MLDCREGIAKARFRVFFVTQKNILRFRAFFGGTFRVPSNVGERFFTLSFLYVWHYAVFKAKNFRGSFHTKMTFAKTKN